MDCRNATCCRIRPNRWQSTLPWRAIWSPNRCNSDCETASGQQELTLVTADRPGLFRTVTGILYGWGMDITKAAAFSNRNGSRG